MDVFIGKPIIGGKLNQTIAFLDALDLGWEESTETTVNIMDGGKIAATGSRQKNVLKCIGVSEEYRGEGLSARLLTELVKDAFNCGHSHLFLYTRPENIRLFSELGFYDIAETKDAALMENKKNGIAEFINAIPASEHGLNGCIVANCNPFTKGHLYLIERAASACDFLYLFILSEESGDFSAKDRLMLAIEGTSHIKNISVHTTGHYMISGATFPTYFLKEHNSGGEIYCDLDLEVFARYFAPGLNIAVRFVGCEPYCGVTAAYNERMKLFLPSHGIRVEEIQRQAINGAAVSASRVRALLKEGRLDAVEPLVPDSTFKYLKGRNNEI